MSELYFPTAEELHQIHVQREYRLSVAGSELEEVEEELAETLAAMFGEEDN